MSTLLERMIQRTRAPLSSLEPLSGARLAPAPAGQHAAGGHPAGPPVEAAEAEPDIAVVASQDRPPAVSSSAQRGLPSGARLRVGSAGPGSARPADEAGRTGPDAARPTDEGGLTAAPRSAETRRGLGSAARAERDGVTADLPAMPPQDVTSVTSGEIAPGIERPTAPAAAETPKLSAVMPAAVTPRVRPAPSAYADDLPSGSPAPRESAARTLAAGPQVTISIGHIEVRAAPAIEPPQSRPPFRPRVSLADFLSQQQERRP